MCTATWIGGPEGYELFFNRDELLTRGPERAPQVELRGGVRCILPRDGDAGGSWIAVNEHGLSLCLLNGYIRSRGSPPARPRSRGEWIPGLIDAATLTEIRVRVADMDLASYPPCRLLAFDPEGAALEIQWDGLEAHEHVAPELASPICSSSKDPRGALAFRSELLERLRAQNGGLDAAVLARFHRSHCEQDGALGPCMHRPDAATKSHVHVRVESASVALSYAPGSPCRTPLREPLRLERRRPSSAPA